MEIYLKQCPKCSFVSQCDIILNYHLKEIHNNYSVDDDTAAEVDNDDDVITKCLCDDCKLETELKFGILNRLENELGGHEQYEISLTNGLNIEMDNDGNSELIHHHHLLDSDEQPEDEEDDEEVHEIIYENSDICETIFIEGYDEDNNPCGDSSDNDQVQLYNVQYN